MLKIRKEDKWIKAIVFYAVFRIFLMSFFVIFGPGRPNPKMLTSNSKSTHKYQARSRILRSGFENPGPQMVKFIFPSVFSNGIMGL